MEVVGLIPAGVKKETIYNRKNAIALSRRDDAGQDPSIKPGMDRPKY